MKREKEFVKEGFSMGEYLGKVLEDESGECTRIRDGHIRILSKQNKELAKEIIEKRDMVRDSLKMLVEMVNESKRVVEELPELFLPLLECGKRDSTITEKQKAFKDVMERIEGGKQLITKDRELMYKEKIDFIVDEERISGRVYVSSDILVLSAEKKSGGEEMYNAFLLKECAVSVEDAALLISIPPIRVEIVSGEHSGFSKLKTEIDRAQKKGRERAERTAVQEESRKNALEEDKEEKREYNRYLIQIGYISRMENPSVDEIAEEIRCIYRAEQSWKKAKRALDQMKKKDIYKAFSLFCEISNGKVTDKIEGIVEERVKVEEAVNKAGAVIKSHMKKVLSLFKEDSLSGHISLYFESVHIKSAEIFIRHYMHFSSGREGSICADALKKCFVYDGYTFSYTVEIAQQVQKEILRKRYAFTKRILQHAFGSASQENEELHGESIVNI